MSFSLPDNIKNYRFEYIVNDLKAGAVVGAIGFPQSMAYALIAGVNPIYGIYTSAVAAMVSTFTGNSSHMIIGPTNIMALAVASSLNFLQGENYLQGVFLLTLLVGIIQILLGVLKLGKLVNYVSHSVFVGLMTGVAVIISISQIGNLLGLDVELGPNIFVTLYRIAFHLEEVNYYSLGAGALTFALLLLLQKKKPRFPSYIIAVVVSAVFVYLFRLGDQIIIVDDFQASTPDFVLYGFDYNLILEVFSSALSIALLGFLHIISVAKELEKETQESLELNREFIGQGIVNMACAFTRGFAVTGSISRTFTNYKWGAKSRFSGFVSGLVTVLIFILLFPIIPYIPIPTLAVIVLLVVYKLTDWEEIVLIFKTTRFDSLIFSVTFLITVISTRLDYAIYFGVLLSFILVLKNSSSISYTHFRYNGDEKESFSRRSLQQVEEDDCIIINLAGTLHFNSAENLKNELNETFSEDKVFVVRMREIEDIDLTSVQELDKFIEKVQNNGGEVVLSGVSENMYRVLEQFGVTARIKKENIFTGDGKFFDSTKEALARAEDEYEKNVEDNGGSR